MALVMALVLALVPGRLGRNSQDYSEPDCPLRLDHFCFHWLSSDTPGRNPHPVPLPQANKNWQLNDRLSQSRLPC
jgi:hypothetical protein